MNKSVLALAVAAITSAGAVNAAEIYKGADQTLEMGGRAEARLSVKDGDAADKTRVRLNFKGTTQITDGLYGVGFYEGEFTNNDNGLATDSGSNGLNNRYTYAGLGGNFGEVTYGKNDGALGVITDFTDIMAYAGNSAADKISVADRTNNNLGYKGTFGDFSAKANYRFDDADKGEISNDGYALSGIYAFGDSGFKLGAGYADQADANEMMFAGSYTMGDLYFAGTFTNGEKQKSTSAAGVTTYHNGSVDYTGYEAAVAYTMGKTVFTSTYNNAETNDETSADNFAVDATYFFNANFRTYISYNFNLISKGDKIGSTSGLNGNATSADAEDELALGMRYDF
ncbi:porin [Aliivibrio sp. S4TY2]|uniref:porin n=1 Tax=unclassified Aliivibrio TaxID=2645654 RepID=UPI002379AF92|nr:MULTISPECIES: porin [unclassified Aliivibrio]MDD9157269.1 porin [Aliivibrio sp. S4TY2]MDD9161151.1 porin [Aliivibrio sp. S4TY1]MDD9165181.1 porin [Aliivibrio sp. S4MY2]MDD9169179.1 porin [Aliivibrio sp. S4MY4]MDD9185998.1 porin [Aliivibrio sp. S4MY3]